MFKISLFFILLLGISKSALSQVSVYSCGSFGVLTEDIINQSAPEHYGTCIDFNDASYSFSTSQYNIVTASESIHLHDGFYAGQFTNGQMHLRLGEKSDFDVAVMNYPDLDGILKFEKFELGIDLPTDIQTKVNNFVNNASVPASEKLNPYVDLIEDINGVAGMKVTAEYICYQTGEVFLVDGFYNQEFQPYSNPLSSANGATSDEKYNSLGGYIPLSTNYSFLNRFAPNKTGLWLCKIKITSTGISYESNIFTFNVIESENPGYMGITENGRYLKHNGKTFIPIGCNALWPQNTLRQDPDLWSVIPYSEQYLSQSKMIPRTYDNFRNRLNSIHEYGANSFRVIMAPWAIDIEYGQLGNYTMHQFQAQEMDNIIELADQENFFIQLDMSVHYPFIPFSNLSAGSHTSWNGFYSIYGDHNAYKDIPGVESPLDFFSNLTARDYYKQRIRYILARWGYSTQISVIELMSEINQVGTDESTLSDNVSAQLPYLQNPSIYASWNKDMAAYFKSHHNGKVHLLTSGYASFGSIYDDSYDDPNFDVIGINKYDDGIFSFGSYVNETFSKRLLNYYVTETEYGNPDSLLYPLKTTYENPNIKTKPLIISETGFTGINNTTHFETHAYNPPLSGCETNVTEIKRQMWQMLFSGAAASYQWTAFHFPELWPEFGRMNDFVQGIEFGDVYNPYKPGASITLNINGDDYWLFDEHASEFMDQEKEFRADCIYMVNQDKTKAVGVITNKTYNQYSSSPNTNCNTGQYDVPTYNGSLDNNPILRSRLVLNRYQYPYEFSNSIEWEGPISIDVEDLQIGLASKALKLTYMNNDGYTINYYNRSDINGIPSVSFDNANGFDNQVRFEKTINGNENDFILPFVAIQNNSGNKSLNINQIETVNLNSKVLLYPNPVNEKLNYSLIEEIDKVEIVDLMGNIILSNKVVRNEGELEFKGLHSGVYFVNFYNKEILIRLEKIIKL